MTGKSSLKVKWWEVSLQMQGGRNEGQEESSGSDANAHVSPPPIEPQDGALSTSCSRKKKRLSSSRYRK